MFHSALNNNYQRSCWPWSKICILASLFQWIIQEKCQVISVIEKNPKVQFLLLKYSIVSKCNRENVSDFCISCKCYYACSSNFSFYYEYTLFVIFYILHGIYQQSSLICAPSCWRSWNKCFHIICCYHFYLKQLFSVVDSLWYALF